MVKKIKINPLNLGFMTLQTILVEEKVNLKNKNAYLKKYYYLKSNKWSN